MTSKHNGGSRRPGPPLFVCIRRFTAKLPMRMSIIPALAAHILRKLPMAFSCLNICRTFLLVIMFGASLTSATRRVPGEYARIQSAVDAADSGDTILIEPGIYRENITLHKVLTVKNSSASGTVTLEDTTRTPALGYVSSNVITIAAAGPGRVEGLSFAGVTRYNVYACAIRVLKDSDGWTVRGCMFDGIAGVQSYEAAVSVERCLFKKNKDIAVSAGKNSRIIGNRIFGNRDDGVIATQNVLIANNLFVECAMAVKSGGQYDTVTVQNNTFSSIGNMYANNQISMYIGWDQSPMIIRNNIIAFNNGFGMMVSSSNTNIPDKFRLMHNNVFMNSENYFFINDPTGSDGNISVDPRFGGPDSLFYLTSDSPCIDAGLAEIKDTDGSPSDIGMYGGPDAPDLRYAPAAFTVSEPADAVTIRTHQNPYLPELPVPFTVRWTPSWDRDAGAPPRYRLIIGRDRFDNCRRRSCNTFIVSQPIDTLVTDSLFATVDLAAWSNGTYYYSVEAFDGDGLSVRAEPLRSFTVHRDHIEASNVFLSQNYPNPFNGTTTIRFGLPFAADVAVKLFDLLGREVRTLRNGVHGRGYHFISLDAAGLSSGVYIYELTMRQSAALSSPMVMAVDVPQRRKLVVIK